MVDKRRLGLKPDWGKPTVRNFREGSGNVTRGAGLRPTAKAVDTPPDPTVGAPALYPTRGKNLRPRNGDGRAELDREFAAEDAPFSGGRFVVKIVATIR